MFKPLTVWIITNCGKLLKRWECQTILPVSWETYLRVKKQQLELCLEQLSGSGLKKEYNKFVYCHPVCLTYTRSTSCTPPDVGRKGRGPETLGSKGPLAGPFRVTAEGGGKKQHGRKAARSSVLAPLLERRAEGDTKSQTPITKKITK